MRQLCAAAKPLGDDIGLRRFGAARRRLGVAHLGEGALQGGQQRALGAALEHLGDEGAARLQHASAAKAKAASASATMRRWSVAAWPVAGAAMSLEHEVGRPAERRADRRRRRRVAEIALDQQVAPGDRIGRR